MFSIYFELWQQISKGFRRFRLRSETIREILCALCLVPLRYSNLRAKVHGRVTASDASNTGGGLVASSGLTLVGINAVLQSSGALLESSRADNSQMSSLLVREFLRNTEYRGSDVRLDVGVVYRPLAWPRMSISPDKWNWITIKSVPFHNYEHINVLELRMFLFSLRWRARSSEYFGTRFLHLLDSQVAIAVAVKGRSSSRQLNQVLRRVSALSLAFDIYPLVAFVGTSVNPADAASRVYQ